MNSPIIISLDSSFDEAIKIAKIFGPELCRLKVGSQLYTSSGPKIIDELSKLGYEIFLDLKFHDIPNTVFESVKSAANLGVWMLNIHTSGGSKMMKSARKALDSFSEPPLLIGVTMLTSLSNDDIKEIGISDISNNVINLAKLAHKNDLDGVVCSPKEVSEIRALLGKDFITVTPGIRPTPLGDDQARTSTPKEALVNGSDFLVIGRPVTAAENPLESLKEILNKIDL